MLQNDYRLRHTLPDFKFSKVGFARCLRDFQTWRPQVANSQEAEAELEERLMRKSTSADD